MKVPVKNDSPFPEKTPPGALLKAARVSSKKSKGKQGEKVRKERIRQQKEKAACSGNGHGQYGYKKALKRFRLRASVKTATTYSPTCAVPSA